MDDKLMYCEKYRCKMSKHACVIRQRNAKAGNLNNGISKPGGDDTNCVECNQGKEIILQVSPRETDQYSNDLKKIRVNARRKKWGTPPNAKLENNHGKIEEQKSMDKQIHHHESGAPIDFEKRILLDFNNYPEILNALRSNAIENMRTPELQAIHIIQQAVLQPGT